MKKATETGGCNINCIMLYKTKKYFRPIHLHIKFYHNYLKL